MWMCIGQTHMPTFIFVSLVAWYIIFWCVASLLCQFSLPQLVFFSRYKRNFRFHKLVKKLARLKLYCHPLVVVLILFPCVVCPFLYHIMLPWASVYNYESLEWTINRHCPLSLCTTINQQTESWNRLICSYCPYNCKIIFIFLAHRTTDRTSLCLYSPL